MTLFEFFCGILAITLTGGLAALALVRMYDHLLDPRPPGGSEPVPPSGNTTSALPKAGSRNLPAERVEQTFEILSFQSGPPKLDSPGASPSGTPYQVLLDQKETMSVTKEEMDRLIEQGVVWTKRKGKYERELTSEERAAQQRALALKRDQLANSAALEAQEEQQVPKRPRILANSLLEYYSKIRESHEPRKEVS